MHLVSTTAAKDFSPTSPQADAAARRFIADANTWSERMRDAQRALYSFVASHVGLAPRGFVSRDKLNMSVFGLIFDKSPGAGFLAVPGPVGEDLRSQGVRGDGYFPDTSHPLGKQVLSLLNQVSRVAEQRPLLNTVPGVSPLAIEDDRVVLTRAVMTSEGIVVKAAPAAVTPAAEVAPVSKPAAVAAEASEPVSRPRPKM